MIRLHIPVLFLAATSPFWFATTTWLEVERSTEPEVKQHTGHVTAWKVTNDGSVYLRLEGTDPSQKPFKLWFVTPPERTATTEFERYVLQILLEMRGAKAGAAGKTASLTVRADDSNDNGRKLEDALELVSIGSF